MVAKQFKAAVIELLGNLIDFLSGKSSLTALPSAGGGFQSITINDNTTVKHISSVFIFPDASAKVAIISIEADPNSTNLNRVVRFLENGSDPTTTSGLALGDNDIYKIEGLIQIFKFRIIGIESGKTHIVRIQLYS